MGIAAVLEFDLALEFALFFILGMPNFSFFEQKWLPSFFIHFSRSFHWSDILLAEFEL